VSSCQAGFGLIELMVSITIMAIVSSIILFRHEAFNSATLLRSQAYEVALRIREVQFSSVSATGVSGDFNSVNGVFFDTAATEDGSYKIFTDADSDYFYDSNEGDGPAGVLDKRFEISEIRDDGGTTYPDIVIDFKRPNFDAIFYQGANTPVSTTFIEIDVARRGAVGVGCGEIRTVEITKTGQISVKTCP
jgi:prepilin-type N-terminal cleavage/methylation domain-containing protein